ncbi:H-2 class II histocompatibility antigen, A-U alpha chain-like [Anabas testudineus]|uniref:H-2 class II histocompatibility antigen, A-U alpha chain-like n=1 Tax=Anabas testudineus TaxID=64144 RepID=UPI000F36D8AD|nr:H-2 class II histocompatibility antigen, A-U alpha chain-like [Anabas testudineus]
MKRSAVILLILNNFLAFSQIAHEVVVVVACFDNGQTELQVELDSEEIAYVDFERQEFVYTVPRFVILNPSAMIVNIGDYTDASRGKRRCSEVIAYCKGVEKNPPEEKDPPQGVLYPAEEVQLGVENRLICFVSHFYPPYIQVSWYRNGRPVSEGVSLSRYYPNNDGTFHQFSTVTFTPSDGDIYSCTVEHSALDMPKTYIWEP